jgi:hypothetical protein
MKYKILIYCLACFTVILLSACSKTNRNNQVYNGLGKKEITPIILEKLNIKEYSSIPNGKDNSFIYLESIPNSAINEVNKLLFCDEKLIILDKRQKTLLVFGEDGRFISKIDNIGNGPDEYLQINDFCVSENTKSIFALVVAGIHKTMVHEYGLDGRLKNKFSIPFIGYNIGTFDNYLAFYSDYSSNSPKDFNIHITTKECRVLGEYFPCKNRSQGWGLPAEAFTQCDDQLFYHPIFCDTVYRFSGSKPLEPYIILKDKESSHADQYLDLYMNSSMEKYMEYVEKNPFRQFFKLIITEDSIFFNSDHQGIDENYVFNTRSSTLHLFKGGDYLSLLKTSPLLVHKKQLITITNPYEIHNFINTVQKRISSKKYEEFKSENKDLIEIFEHTSPNNNPVIIKFS